MTVYVFCIGVFVLVNLPAAEYMHNNPVYQIIFEDIPKNSLQLLQLLHSVFIYRTFCFIQNPVGHFPHQNNACFWLFLVD